MQRNQGKKNNKSSKDKNQVTQINIPEKPKLTPKEEGALKRQKAKEKQEFISFTSTVFFISLFLGLLLFPVGGIKATGGAIGGIMTMALSYKYPNKGLWAFLMYMPFSGTVVYGLVGGNPVFQLAKDAFFIPALINIIQQFQKARKPILIPKQVKPFLILLVLMCLVTFLTANLVQNFTAKYIQLGEKPLMIAFFGFKSLLGYFPLITCAYHLIKGKKELLFWTRLNVILALICCGLSIVQYQFLSSGRCEGTRNKTGQDLYEASVEARCLVGGSLLYSPDYGVIRLPGTFVSPWHWAWFLISNAFFTYATAFCDPSGLWRGIGLAGMAFVFINAVISGQRIALMLVPVVTIILLILTGQIANFKRFLPIAAGLFIVGIIGTTMFPDVVQERINSVFDRVEASPPTEFITSQAEFTSKGKNVLFGNGLGRATNSARTFGFAALIETYYPKLLYEIGWTGTISFFLLASCLTFVTFKTYRSLKDKNLRNFGASFWVFVLCISYNTYWYPLDTDPVSSYYWFVIGVILRLPEIEKQEREELLLLQDQQVELTKKKGFKKVQNS